MNSAPVRTSRQYRLISAGLAFVVWGAWAWFVNQLEDRPDQLSPVGSGLIQGTASCLITLFMLRSVTHLYHRFSALRYSAPTLLFLPAILTTALTSSCLSVAHLLAGTANVVGTVLPGIIVALCFNTLTCWKLHQQFLTQSPKGNQPAEHATDAIR